MRRLDLLLAATFAGALVIMTTGCAETHSSERVPYTGKPADNFNWTAYQAIPKSERAALAPLQKEWLDLIDRSLNDYRQAYAAKNGVARDALIAEAVQRQKTSYQKLIQRIDAEGLDNWAFRVSESGLVMGPAVVFDYWLTGPHLIQQPHHAVSQSFFLSIKADLSSIAPQSRESIANADADSIVFVSLPPAAFTISHAVADHSPLIFAHRVNRSDGLPALAAPRHSLFVEKSDRLRLTSKREPQTYQQLLAEKRNKEAAAIEAEQQHREREAAAAQQQIADLKEGLVQHIYTHSVSPSAVRRWLGRSGQSDSHLDDKPVPQVLLELERRGIAVQELLEDTRLAFAASLEPTPDSRLHAFIDAKTIQHEFFDGDNLYAPRAKKLSRELADFFRADANSSRILIDVAALPAARYRATDPGREGNCWITRLAQLAVLWDRGEAIVVSSSQQNVRFGDGSLAEYLKSLPHQSVETPGVYGMRVTREQQRRRGANFARFDQLVAAARSDKMPKSTSAEPQKAEANTERQRRLLEIRQRRGR